MKSRLIEMNKHLIQNSTKSEREKRVHGAIVISMLDSEAPSEKAVEIYQKYIDGEMELDEVKEKIIKMYDF